MIMVNNNEFTGTILKYLKTYSPLIITGAVA